MRSWLIRLLPLFLLAAPVRADDPAANLFESRIRPVLAERCWSCHGEKKQHGGLRLDGREALLSGGDGGPAIVPGDPEASRLIEAIRQTGDELKMPPEGGKLPDETIATLADWIKAGAPWPEAATTKSATDDAAASHWAFRPVTKPDVPTPAGVPASSNPIDAFVRAKLVPSGLAASPEADRRTLIRRLSFDLTGLPPTPGEIDAFLQDPSPIAYERLVDRLLASPHYGERWGRHWLDVARYADTKGYVFQEERRYAYAYTYRDWVIQAFNADLPYDRFILQQLAADRLSDDGDTTRLAALGFLTVGRRFLNVQEDIMDDRIDVTTRGFLGLTVACARCHDHKYDPIPAEDYYSLYGIFASCEEPKELPIIARAGSDAAARDFEAKRTELQAKVDAFVGSKLEAIQTDLREKAAAYWLAAFDLDFQPRNPKLADRAKADGLNRGRLRFMAGRWKQYLDATKASGDPVLAPWHALAALPAEGFAERVASVLDALAPGSEKPANAVVIKALREAPPASLRDVADRYGELLAQALPLGESIDGPDGAEWAAIRRVLHDPSGPITLRDDDGPGLMTQFSEEATRLFDLADRMAYNKLKNEVDALKATHSGAPARAMVVADRPEPFRPYVFLRGNINRRGPEVPRRFLKVISGPERPAYDQGSGRLELARAIARPDNPLTARVLVNRVWMHHFGQGLVRTPSDFGTRSDPPSHPELLDWLAATFVEKGWSIKSLHRLIVTSATYRQQSLDLPDAAARDPQNLLLWRQNRRRLEFEPLRDGLLAAAGRLDPSIGGRSVSITTPPYSNRRTVYALIDRQNLDGLFRAFDFANPDASAARRFVTTVPQQALFLMNGPLVVECAQGLAARPELTTAGSDDERIRRLHGLLFGRDPTARELELGRAFVASRSSADGLDAWAQYAQVLLMSNEFAFVD
jgi:hypothetical protein